MYGTVIILVGTARLPALLGWFALKRASMAVPPRSIGMGARRTKSDPQRSQENDTAQPQQQSRLVIARLQNYILMDRAPPGLNSPGSWVPYAESGYGTQSSTCVLPVHRRTVGV